MGLGNSRDPGTCKKRPRVAKHLRFRNKANSKCRTGA